MAPSATASHNPTGATAVPLAAGADAPHGNSAAAAIRGANGLNGEASKQHGLHFDTLAIHKGSEPDPTTGAIIPNIALATAYQQKQVGMSGDKGFDYSRFSNPNRNAFEANVAALEGAKYGFAFASGTAVTSAFMGMVPYGGHVVSVNDVYGGTFKLQGMFKETSNVTTTLLDLDTDGMEERLEAAMQPNTKLVWIETPTNPTLRLINIEVVSQIAKRLNPDVYVVVDSTFPSPWYQNPLALGADAVMHSCTKYINGHSDVLMGVAVTSHEEIARRLKLVQSGLGAVPSPFDCWLVLRGLKTLPIRMREHGRISLRLARYLDAHPLISEVIYPGLPAHPSFKLVKAQIAPKALQAQMDDGVDIEQGIQYSGMLSFRLACDPRDREPGSKLLTALKVITLAVSLGGVESLIEQPSTMTHFMIPEEERLKLGLGHDLIRMSVGLEDPRDLEHDLDQALQQALGSAATTVAPAEAEQEAKRRKLA